MTNTLNILCLALHVTELNKSQSFFSSLKMLSISFNPKRGFPGSSAGKESTCNWIPGSGRTPGKGVGQPLQCTWASLVKNWEGDRQEDQGSPNGGNGLPASRHFFLSPLSSRRKQTLYANALFFLNDVNEIMYLLWN